MSDFNTHDEATRLADCHSGYALAKMVVGLRKERDESESQWHSLLSQTPECNDCGWQDNVKREVLQAAVTRRDLLKQAEALEEIAAVLKKNGHDDAAQTARIKAHANHQQANQRETDQ